MSIAFRDGSTFRGKPVGIQESPSGSDEIVRPRDYATGQRNSMSLHATALRASMTLFGEARDQELRRLERIARRERYTSVANTIALDLADESKDLDEKVKKLESVIRSNDEQYNVARAIVAKAESTGAMKGYSALSDADLRTLGRAYSYLYSQRVSSIFDACHDALWRGLEANHHVLDLLHLFKYTSFIWRIRGEEKKEADYVRRIDQKTVQQVQVSMPQKFALEVHYYWRRFRVLVVGVMGARDDRTGYGRLREWECAGVEMGRRPVGCPESAR